jgi:hypothetical protein
VRNHIAVAALAASLAVGATAFGAQHLVRAGDDWSKLATKLQPGDEIVLMPGKHRPAAFEGLAGTAEKPIVIRSADPKSPVMIEATDIGLALRGARFVQVNAVAVVGARRCGILIQGSAEAPCEGVSLRTVYVAKTGDLAERSPIRIERARDIEVVDARIEGWHHAGIHVAASERVRLDKIQFVGMSATPEEIGIAIDGVSKEITIDRCRFAAGIGTAAAIGLGTTDPPPSPPAPPTGPDAPKPDPAYLAQTVTLEHSVAERVDRFVAFGSCRDVTVHANTVVEPVVGYEVTVPPKGFARISNSVLVANLFTWTPGRLKHFAVSAPSADPTGLALEANLWWSAELPGAKSLLGDFVGEVKSPQVMDVDPRLDGYSKPMEERAKAFGTEAP